MEARREVDAGARPRDRDAAGLRAAGAAPRGRCDRTPAARPGRARRGARARSRPGARSRCRRRRARRSKSCGAARGTAARVQLVAEASAGSDVNRGRFERLVVRHRRQGCRASARQHRLAGARRADHQEVVAAGGGDLERALGVRLALHVGEIRVAGARRDPLRRGEPRRAAPRQRGARTPRAAIAPGRIRGAADQRRLVGVRARQDERARPSRRAPRSSRARRGSDAARRRARARRRTRSPASASRPSCREAARMPIAIGRSKRPLSLRQVGRREVDGDAPRRKFEARS